MLVVIITMGNYALPFDGPPERETWDMVDTLCAGCEHFVPVDDMGLCQQCSAKLDRDLIRARDWAYSVIAALTPETERETLRLEVIARCGAAYELIQPPTQVERRHESLKQFSNRMIY
jgi:hypothetical protein